MSKPLTQKELKENINKASILWNTLKERLSDKNLDNVKELVELEISIEQECNK